MKEALVVDYTKLTGYREEAEAIMNDLLVADECARNLSAAFDEDSGTVYHGQASENLSVFFGSMAGHTSTLCLLMKALDQYIEGYIYEMQSLDLEAASVMGIQSQ